MQAPTVFEISKLWLQTAVEDRIEADKVLTEWR